MTLNPPRATVGTTVALFVLGVALRLPGLFLNGIGDLREILLDWGASVHHLGLVDAFGINYGLFSYACYGIAEAAGEWMPRFWWAPYKLMVVMFDASVCLALLALTPSRDRRLVLLLVWLNPWFVLHGAYHGFWEGPHLLCGLLAVLALQQIHSDRAGWAAAGALVMCSGMFKPQGVVYFAVPLGLFLLVEACRGASRPLRWFSTGVAAVAGATALTIWIAGGPALALYDNYRSAATVMPNLSNGGPGIWRFGSWAYLRWSGQPGQVWDMDLSNAALLGWTLAAGTACLLMLLVFSRRLGLQRAGADGTTGSERTVVRCLRPVTRWPAPDAAFAFMTIGSLVMAQFGLHAHINHAYSAVLLLTIWVLRDPRLMPWWIAIMVILGTAHFSTFGFGDPGLLPPASELARYPQAVPLIDSVRDLPAYHRGDDILRFQAALNRSFGLSEAAISILSLAVFFITCGIIRRLFHRVGQPVGVLTQPPASDQRGDATAIGDTGGRETPVAPSAI